MALETGTYISDLVITNPTSGDPKSQGDDHLRLLKVAVVNTNALEGHGHCRLAKSGSNLVLSPYKGSLLTINGKGYPVPSAGVSLAPTSLTAGTLYYIYAYMSGTTMTLEASATTHATDSTTGVEIKSGDATRTLVGMARPATGPAWAYSATDKSVRSWYNEGGISAGGSSANQASTSTSLVNVANVTISALLWNGEQVSVNGTGGILAGAGAAGATLVTQGAVNSSALGSGSVVTATANQYSPYAFTYYQDVSSDGYYSYQTYASTSIATSSTWTLIYLSIASGRHA